MSRAKRTTKQIAQRIDLNYFKRRSPWRTWRLALSILLPCLGVVWLAAYGLARNNWPYSVGKLSPAHAVLTQRCETCHISRMSSFRATAADQACLSCHDGPTHQANQVFTPTCASCHVEHRGQMRLAATANESCTQCHSDLRTAHGQTSYMLHITEFSPEGHPEFAALRPGFRDPGTIKLNHAIHMKANLLGPNGTHVQLDCADCHRANPSDKNWRFGSSPVHPSSTVATAPEDETTVVVEQVAAITAAESGGPPSHSMARAYMQPVTYAKNCIGCHPLLFDKRFTESVPHDTPEVVHAFLLKKFQDYIAAHPAELREVKSTVAIPAKPLPISPRIYTPEQWVAARVAEAEELLWGKTCKQCHSLSFAPVPAPATALPQVAKSNITVRWFQHAVFDHQAHRMWTCTSCHTRATTSQETADVLVPPLRTCARCHHTGSEGAEARCFECHTYHDWTKVKEAKGTVRLSLLVSQMKIPGS